MTRLRAVQAAIEAFGSRVVQPAVVRVLLVFVYAFGVGASWALCKLFRRELFAVGPPERDGSYWQPASGYDGDLRKQS